MPKEMRPRDPQSPLSIGLVAPGWPPDAFPNGIVTYVATLLPSLRKLGHRVSVLAGQVAGGMAAPDVRNLEGAASARTAAERLWDAISSSFDPHTARMRQLRRSLRRGIGAMVLDDGIDILEMEESFGNSVGIRDSVRIPVCVRLHGPWFLNGPVRGVPDDKAFRKRLRAERMGIASADGVTAPSADVLRRVKEYYGLELPGAAVIPPPVLPVETDARWRLEACDASRVLFVGRFDRHKGGDIAIDAFARVMKEHSSARLCFVGPDRGCVADDGRTWSLADYVKERLPGALAAGRVELLGQQPLGVLAALRRSAIVTMVASRYETFCLAAAEAMALGCPVVAPRAGAIPEVIRDRSNGLLCRPEDPSDLAEKVLLLLSDPPLAAALGAQAALDCERDYNPGVIAARLVDYYRRILSAGGIP